MANMTAGQVLINSALPEELRNYDRVMDKGSLNDVLKTVASKYPKDYPKIVYKLKKLGEQSAYYNGSSFSLSDFKSPIDKNKILEEAEKQIALRTVGVKDEKKKERIFVEEFVKARDKIEDSVLKESLKKDNALAHMVVSGARGSKGQLNSTIGSPVMYTDHLNRPILSPVKNSFSQGLTPTEYIAHTPGTRKGVVSTKFATPLGGFFNKQMGYVTNNIIVSEDDCRTSNFINEPTNDKENLGRVLAKTTAGIPAGTVIDNRILSIFIKKKLDKIPIRSPLTCESEVGVCKLCRGYTEKGSLASLGDNVGIDSSSALSEPFTQGAMKEKHKGGTIGALNKAEGFDLIRQLLKVPKVFKGGAAIAEVDGKVTKIEDAGQGGKNIYVNDTRHYAPRGFKLKVKQGDSVEAGQSMSDGIINPAQVVAQRGIGEGRLSLFNSLRDAYQEDGKKINKVHMETVARGMINNVRVNEFSDDLDAFVPGDITTYTSVQKKYSPVESSEVPVNKAGGYFLVKPYMHYTPGTKLKKSMINDLMKNGVKSVRVTHKEPPFTPHMVRLDDVPSYKDNWVARLFSDKLKNKILKSVHRGDKAKVHSDEFIPSYIYAKDFGKVQIGY